MNSPWLPVRKRVQSELIKRGHCVGCTRSLADADRQPFFQDLGKEVVLCRCRRVFVYDRQLNSYRRATQGEWEQSSASYFT